MYMLQALSYYKIFGYPSGLGALLVRKEASQILRRRYFGGGTVLACSAEIDFVRQVSKFTDLPLDSQRSVSYCLASWLHTALRSILYGPFLTKR